MSDLGCRNFFREIRGIREFREVSDFLNSLNSNLPKLSKLSKLLKFPKLPTTILTLKYLLSKVRSYNTAIKPNAIAVATEGAKGEG